jgi:hypothetical protein
VTAVLDFKKEYKELYQPKTTPSVVDVPEMTFIMVDGKGDPNTSAEYAAAVELLYGLSYAIKMSNKEILVYVVPPLEGFWSVADPDFKGSGAAIADKSRFEWTMMIRQPDFVTENIFQAAAASLQNKKPHLDVTAARLEKLTERLCVQVMHIGSYDDEPKTIMALERFITESGYLPDFSETRRHHEIYLSDPRKVAADKLKTMIRHPVKNA